MKTKHIPGITPTDVKEIMNLVAGEDALGKLRKATYYSGGVTNGSAYYALSLSKECWRMTPSHFEAASYTVSERKDWGEYKGLIFADTLRAEVLACISQVVDMNKVKSAYAMYIADKNEVMRIDNLYVKICNLSHVTRCMLLSGMEWTEVYINENTDQIRFVAYYNNHVAAIITCMAVHGWNDVKDRFPLIGSVVVMENDAEAQIVPEVIKQNIAIIKAFDVRAKQDALDTRKVFAVRLVMYKTTYVLANTVKDAEEIASNWTNADDFDDGFEVDETVESDISEARDADELYDKDGEVDIDDYIDSLEEDE